MIRATKADDVSPIMAIVEASGQFDVEGLAFVEQTLREHLGEGGAALWLTADDGEAVGVAYCAPEPVASGTWNLLMLWTRNDRQGQGLGSELVAHLEIELRARDARLLVVETSSLPGFAPARSFYAKTGFVQEASIRNFYAAGDDKIVFTKPLSAVAP